MVAIVWELSLPLLSSWCCSPALSSPPFWSSAIVRCSWSPPVARWSSWHYWFSCTRVVSIEQHENSARNAIVVKLHRDETPSHRSDRQWWRQPQQQQQPIELYIIIESNSSELVFSMLPFRVEVEVFRGDIRRCQRRQRWSTNSILVVEVESNINTKRRRQLPGRFEVRTPFTWRLKRRFGVAMDINNSPLQWLCRI